MWTRCRHRAPDQSRGRAVDAEGGVLCRDLQSQQPRDGMNGRRRRDGRRWRAREDGVLLQILRDDLLERHQRQVAARPRGGFCMRRCIGGCSRRRCR